MHGCLPRRAQLVLSKALNRTPATRCRGLGNAADPRWRANCWSSVVMLLPEFFSLLRAEIDRDRRPGSFLLLSWWCCSRRSGPS
jgi:hypothetical protein